METRHTRICCELGENHSVDCSFDSPLYLCDSRVSTSSSKQLLFPKTAACGRRKSRARWVLGSRGRTALQGVECNSGVSAVNPSLTRRKRKSQTVTGGREQSAARQNSRATACLLLCDCTFILVEAREPVYSRPPQQQRTPLFARLLDSHHGLQLNSRPASRLRLAPPR